MSGKFIPCADFDDLAPLKALDRDILHSNDPKKSKLNAFILTLALVFNDLKGLLWVIERLVEGKPQDKGINAYRGQWSGFDSQYMRLACGVLHEFLMAVVANKDVLQHPDFQSCIKRQHAKVKRDWLDVSSNTPAGKKPKTQLGQFLLNIRNNMSFHYYQNKTLMSGYNSWLQTQALESQSAYVSLGKNMSESRFYFADAASDCYFYKAMSDNRIKIDEVKKFVGQVNNVLRFIVADYVLIEQRKRSKRS